MSARSLNPDVNDRGASLINLRLHVKSSELLTRYEAMLRLSREMLASASQQDWDRLIQLEPARTAIADVLRLEDKIVWTGLDAHKKGDLIRALLAADADITKLASSRIIELQEGLGSMSLERKLKKTYNPL
jgi:flagellar protein FliT